ncbi:hypothetical protein [Pseudotenacibaculum haliotis]|uniref:Lipoprotein n=1 Tax=Pseudotenacibaculum haliotis TaxID=1862138 RepID=A0ABW5LRB2_9FLAO
MKTAIYLFMFIGLMTCKSAKIEKNPPFTISGATYNYWFGGQQGVSGIRVIISYETKANDITFDKIYFAKKEGTITISKKEGKSYLIGQINTSKSRNEKGDLILDKDPTKEINNKLPEQTKKIPFELKENEAVIAYTYKGKQRFYKVTKMKQTKTDFYP